MKLFDFDTRNTKPKLRPLQILTVVAAAAVGALLWADPERNAAAIYIVVSVYALGAALALLWAFREQIRYNPYSYNTIFYMGFALFALSVMITNAVLAARIINDPGNYTLYELIRALLGSAKKYMFISAPFLAAFSAALCISNVFLIRREGKRIVNLLGIILSILILSGEILLFVFDAYLPQSGRGSALGEMFLDLFSVIYLYFECMLLGTMVADAIAARHEPEKDKDFLIVLGCGLKKDGTPTPLLKGRLDRALSFYEKQKEETGKELVFITSGGQGPDECVSESAAMKKYLTGHGVPSDRIIEEDRS